MLHPGEAGYDELFDRNSRKNSLKTSARHIYEISDSLKELQAEAAKVCRCDGGNNDCGACRAERKLRAMGENCGMCHQPGCRFCYPKGTEKVSQQTNEAKPPKQDLYASASVFWRNNYQHCAINGGSKTIPELMAEWAGAWEKKPKHPVGVSVLVTDEENGYLLLGRRKGADAAGLLSTPGGRLENETVQECGARELLEECGIVVNPQSLRQIGVKEHFRFDNHYIMFYLHLPLSQTEHIKTMEPDKCEGWTWHRMIDIEPSDCTEPPEIMAKLATILAGW